MKKHFTTNLLLLIIPVILLACGWKPEVTAVPITAPWDSLNLPVKENAVVWKSDPTEFRAVHKEDKRTILKNYTEALKAQGWALGDFNEADDRFMVDMSKDGEPIHLEFYDFNNTGVVIEKKGGATAETDGTAPPTNPTDTTSPNGGNTKAEKADFTVTSEQYDKEFSKEGAKKEDLEKYANKNIAVTGRVSLLSLEKKGTTQPWVTLYAPGVLKGVSCYFDDDNLEQMKQLQMDKVVKVQGFQDDFIVPEVSPSLKHCIVLEAG